MYIRLPDHEPTAQGDDLVDIPAAGPLPKWVGGIIVPIAAIAYGVPCLITGHGVMGNRQTATDLYGPDAIAFGLACVAVGLFMHCHFFWGNIFHQAPIAVLGKIAALILFISSTGYLLIHFGILGH